MIIDRYRGGTLRSLLAYGTMTAGAAGLFLLVRAAGSHLVAPAPNVARATARGVATSNPDVLLHVLLALAVVIVAARGLGALCKRIQQPPAIGEVIAGILLGPSLLGRVSPEATSFLLPPSVAPFLSIIAQIGVILFMFLVGLELDTGQLRHRTPILHLLARGAPATDADDPLARLAGPPSALATP